MNKYLIEYHYRYGKFEKDFAEITVEADTQEEAIQIVRDLKKWVFKITFLEINGSKVER